jgi:arylsulfatase A-like enzyme
LRRHYLRLFFCAICAFIGPKNSSTAATSPNIIVLLADDLGIGDLGVNGQNARASAGLPAISTPNIDKLASQSMSFTRMYSTPICSPSRGSILTGFQIQNLKKDTTDGLEGLRAGEEDKTWAQALQGQGYKTAMYGKWHLGGLDIPSSSLGVYDTNSIPTTKGFEIAFGMAPHRSDRLWENDGAGGLKIVGNTYTPGWPGPGLPFEFTDDAVTDRAVNLIEGSKADARPFAAYVAFNAPHEPFDRLPLGQYADKDWPLVQRQYAANVSNMDANVGRILAAVEDPNHDGDKSDSIASNTLIIFASDNGALWNHANGFVTEYFDSNGIYRGQKSNTYEGGVRAPFFVRWDGVTTPGSTNDRFSNFADLYPTLAELSGADTPVGIDGVSMLSAITGQGPVKQDDAYVSTARWNFVSQQSWSIEMGGWKLTRRFATNSYELYNIINDPSEVTNRASSRPDIRGALEAVIGIEGALEEPYFQNGNNSTPENVYYTQYKTWSPQPGSVTFNIASNWSGGTQYNVSGDPESLYWNTGPHRNWIATVSHNQNGVRNCFVANTMKVLAVEVKSPTGRMQLNLLANDTLDALNGARISSGGVLRFVNGTFVTAREVDVRPGGFLEGAGLITGYQDIIANIPEFQNQRLLEPEVLNAGTVDIYQDSAAGSVPGLMTINGDFSQSASGQLRVDILGNGIPGVDFDKLVVTGQATLGGSLYVSVGDGFIPQPGQFFSILSASSLSIAGLQLTGPAANLFSLAVIGSTDLVLTAGGGMPGDFDGNGVVDGADLAIWQQHYGQVGQSGDYDGNGAIDGADLLGWQRQLGALAPAATANAAVPEPSGLAMIAIGIACPLLTKRRTPINTLSEDRPRKGSGTICSEDCANWARPRRVLDKF